MASYYKTEVSGRHFLNKSCLQGPVSMDHLVKWHFSEKNAQIHLVGKKKNYVPHNHKGSIKGQSVLVYQQMEVKLQPCCLHAIQVNVNEWVGDKYVNRKKETKLFLLSCNYASSELNIHKDFCNSSRCQRPNSLRTDICPAGPFERKVCSD